jgi:glycosidase
MNLNLSTLFITASLLLHLHCKDKDPMTIQPTDPSGPVQYETPFAAVPNTPDIVMYEINERAFSPTGNFAGILPRLDSIKALGVNVLWLMPIHPIGVTKTVNSPYCVADYQKVNPEYGTLEDLRKLVREAHNRKMAVVLDWVANHTSWDNPWISTPSWYTQDGSGNIIQPANTNWQDVADLNFDNSSMRLEMIKAMKYWVLEANVDGFRCDAADLVPFAFWKQAIDSLNRIPNRSVIMLAEGARKDHFSAGFQMNFGWDFYAKSKDIFKSNQAASGYFATHQSEYNAIPIDAYKLRFTSNHDECAWDNTPIVLFGGKSASISAFVVSSYIGGVPLIYNGQEVGCAVKLPFFSNSPINWSTNPDMYANYKKIMSIRAEHPALRTGTLETYTHPDIVAFKRSASSDEVLVLVNTRSAAKTFSIPVALQNSAWKNASSNTAVNIGTSITLNPYEYQILVK